MEKCLNKMCQICERICIYIERKFGHKIDPMVLQDLIERSPTSEEFENEYVFHHLDPR